MINADYSGSGIAPFAGDGRILVEQYFSDGPECSHFSSDNLWGYGQNGGFSLKWSDPVQEGNEFSDTSVIVIKNYFTPATPDGDEDLLDIIGIDPLFGGDNSDAASVYTEQDMELGVYSTTMVLLNGKLVE